MIGIAIIGSFSQAEKFFVMLSEAKHLCFVSGPSIREKSEIESLASRTSSTALQLRFAQNDNRMRAHPAVLRRALLANLC